VEEFVPWGEENSGGYFLNEVPKNGDTQMEFQPKGGGEKGHIWPLGWWLKNEINCK